MITIHAWTAAEKCLKVLTVEEFVARKAEFQASDSVLWIDLASPTEDEERLTFDEFCKVHPLSVEDITRLRREPDAPPHFPKVEEFPDYLFVIVNPLLGGVLDLNAGATLTQLSAVLTDRVLITHHVQPLHCITLVQNYLARHQTQSQRGPDYLFHLILDNTIDEFVPVLDQIEDTLDNLESSILQHPRPAVYLRLLRLKRVIIILRKTLLAEREVLVRLARGEFNLVDERETVYYRNVYDHVVRFAELIDSAREMVSDLMQTYLSAQSNHLSQVMKVLTMISTIILPMTLISGIYGMNFDRLVPAQSNDSGFFIVLCLMLGTGIASFLFFYWRRWL
jgi:magnesium transporter